MMKNIILAVAGLLLIGGVIFFIDYSNKQSKLETNKEDEKVETIRATYVGETETVQAEFDNEADTVSFIEESTGKVTLKRAMSASGTRYTNNDESIVFWEHQGELTITKDGAEVFKGMVESNASTKPPAQGKLDINVVCEGALAYMTFEDGESADAFVAECKAGEHPEVIERYKAEMNLDAGVEI